MMAVIKAPTAGIPSSIKCFIFAPAQNKIMAATITTRTVQLRWGSISRRPENIAIKIKYGSNPLKKYLSSSLLLDRLYEKNKIIDIFRSSEGWKEMGPIKIHLYAPLSLVPIPGILTNTSKTKLITNKMGDILPSYDSRPSI